MPYWEPLPEQCPPAEAEDIAIDIAYRVVFTNPPKQEQFASLKALGRDMPPGTDECRFASCSLWSCPTQVRKIAGLPKVRIQNPLIAELQIAQGSGTSITKNKHIDFWIYDSFDPTLAVVKVEDV